MIYTGVIVPQTQTTWWQRKGCCCLDRYSRNDRYVSPKRQQLLVAIFVFCRCCIFILHMCRVDCILQCYGNGDGFPIWFLQDALHLSHASYHNLCDVRRRLVVNFGSFCKFIIHTQILSVSHWANSSCCSISLEMDKQWCEFRSHHWARVLASLYVSLEKHFTSS